MISVLQTGNCTPSLLGFYFSHKIPAEFRETGTWFTEDAIQLAHGYKENTKYQSGLC